MQANPLACALCSRTTHQVSNSRKIIPGHIPNRHTPSPSAANAGSGGWSLSSRLEEFLSLNMHGKLARISKTNKVHEIYFTCPHMGISNHNYIKWVFLLVLHIFHWEVDFYQLPVTFCPHTFLLYSQQTGFHFIHLHFRVEFWSKRSRYSTWLLNRAENGIKRFISNKRILLPSESSCLSPKQ